MLETTSRLNSYGDSDRGRKRKNNEDCCHDDANEGIFIVVDGVGGEAAGEKAASMAITVLLERLNDKKRGSVADRVREAIALANNKIFHLSQSQEAWRGMACVLTVAVVEGETATIGHVGDTRLYKLSKAGMKKITPDHSPVGEQEDRGELTEEEAMRHPQRNEVYRDVGSEERDKDEEEFIDILSVPFLPDEALLLCSDGLSDMISSQEIRRIIEAHAGTPYLVVKKLIAAANEAGGKDNISVVFVEGEFYAKVLRGELINDLREVIEEELSQHPKLATASADAAITERQEGEEETESPFLQSSFAVADSVKPPSMATAVRPSSPKSLAYGAPATAEKDRQRAALVKFFRALFAGRSAAFLYGLLVGLIAMFFLNQRLESEQPSAISNAAGKTFFTVGQKPPGDFATISEAMAQAQAGTTIEVAPGEYAEQVQLKEGIHLVSRERQKAVIRATTMDAAIVIENVQSGHLEGFRVIATEDSPRATGIRISNSQLVVIGMEISGAFDTALEIQGAGVTVLRDSVIHESVGSGILLKDGAILLGISNRILNSDRRSRNKVAIQSLGQAQWWDGAGNHIGGKIEKSK